MVSITADDDVKVEGNSTTTPFTFTIVRDSGEGTSTVGWTLTGSTDAFDFSSSSSGTVSFGANETSKTITVLVNGDTTVENNETFTVTLNSIDNATIDQSKASASSTILNDDFSQFTPSVFDIAMKDAVKYEGDSGTTQFTFTISRASTVGGASVRWRFLGDGEDPASRSDVKDYEGLVIFDDGEGSKEITVEVKGDLTNENDENFSVILMNAYGATIGASIADGLIRDDDNAPTNISLNASNAMELAATGSVVGTLSAQDPDAGSTFTYALLDSAGGRFRISGNQLLVDNGFLLDFEQGGAHTIKVQVNDGSGHTFVKDLTIAVTDWATEVTAGSLTHDVFKGGAGIDNLAGNAGNDKIYGVGGNDKLAGGAGNDYLWGGAGKDTLTGNAGKDFFVFDSFNAKTNKKTNVDTIKDFIVKDDSIYLDNAVFKALGKAGTLTKPAKMNANAFWTGTAAHDKDDRIIYDNKKGILYYDADGTGKGAAVQIATLSNKAKLTVKDFFII
jgi:Ca2+-binding RTX toxin-like protein